jgi:hypothetical protein
VGAAAKECRRPEGMGRAMGREELSSI